MKILTDFETTVEGDMVTIKCKVVEGGIPGPLSQHTVLHADNKNLRHVCHIQMSNHGYFVRLPQKQEGLAVPNEQWVMKVARVIEPKLNPPTPTK